MPILGLEAAKLGVDKGDYDAIQSNKIAQKVEKAQELLETLRPLETHLKKMIEQGDGPFDLTGDLPTEERLVDVLLDVLNAQRETPLTVKDLALENLEQVSKSQVNDLLSRIEDLKKGCERTAQDSTLDLSMLMNLANAIFTCLAEIVKTNTRHTDRVAAATMPR